MNPPNSWETLSKDWKPRRPSPRLRARLFGPAPKQGPARAGALPWLAPVTVSLLVLLLTFSLRTGGLRLADAAPEPMLALTLSNQSVAAYLPGSFRGQRNRLAADHVAERFGWTKPAGSPSSMGSFIRLNTNYLGR
jgi:hypothetical protein